MSATANTDGSLEFQTVRGYRADNIFTEIEEDPRIPAGWKPRLKEIVALKTKRRLSGADDRLPGVISSLIRAEPVAKPNPLKELAELPYLTMRCKVRTETGDVAVHQLKPGDKVLTRDNGYQPVIWLGMRKLFARDLAEDGKLELIHIKAGALAENTPESDVWVTPAQALLMTPASHWRGIGVSEMLVRAADLVTLDGVEIVELDKIGLVQILLERHEVIMANGAWTASLRPDPDRVDALPKEHREELVSRFPELIDEVPSRPFASARVELKPQTALYLLNDAI